LPEDSTEPPNATGETPNSIKPSEKKKKKEKKKAQPNTKTESVEEDSGGINEW